jgi:hypothetical protein
MPAEPVHIRVVRRFVRRRPRNRECPLTLEPLAKPYFRVVTAAGHVLAYDLDAIASHIVATGSALDPITRETYDPIVLWRIDYELEKAGRPKRGLVSIIHSETERARRRAEKDRQDHIEALVCDFDNRMREMLEPNIAEMRDAIGRMLFRMHADPMMPGLTQLAKMDKTRFDASMQYWIDHLTRGLYDAEVYTHIARGLSETFVRWLHVSQDEITTHTQRRDAPRVVQMQDVPLDALRMLLGNWPMR